MRPWNAKSLSAKNFLRAGEEKKGSRCRTWETQLRELKGGRVADAILQEAKSTSCDLIVIGTHGRRGFSRVLLGSDAENVLRESPVPVLLVRALGAAS